MRATELEQCLSLPFGPSGRSAAHFPDCPAVYVIYYAPRNIVLYVGATIRLRNRCGTHAQIFRSVPNVRVAWFPLPREFHAQTERKLIEALSPALNVTHRQGNGVRVYRNPKDVKRYINWVKKNGNKKVGK